MSFDKYKEHTSAHCARTGRPRLSDFLSASDKKIVPEHEKEHEHRQLLFKAIHDDNAQALKQALDNGVSPNIYEAKVPALIKVCYGETAEISLELVKLLIEGGADKSFVT